MRNIDSLKTDREFQEIFRLHDSVADRFMVVYRAPGSGKLGIICSKKIGNSVTRHRFQRLVREAFRKNRDTIPNDIDIVVIAREDARGQGLMEIESSLVRLAAKKRIFS